jgi:hypothetical protein
LGTRDTVMNERKRWLVVVGYAVAMAWVEAAVVYYLRTMMGRIEPYQPDPLPMIGRLDSVELVRELATLVMLFAIGMLAGQSWRARWGCACIAFGVWDIFYYVFLKLICNWPHSLLAWDILFLIPLPWWGPVLAPVLIAMLMIAWGTLASQFDEEASRFGWNWRPWLLGFTGIVMALYLFMADALRAAGQGRDAIRQVLPGEFAWGWFTIAAVLMSSPVAALAWKNWRRRPIDSRVTSAANTAPETIQPDFAK